ncbi:hypothetical protein SAMN04489764_1863 [Thermostaphylospora chromogena]|uniref:Uncharacterized protein n=1 Tax=Thermostaphylospora chromogena TaxID=35622 RepID=A0A1H1D7Q8_9ACTN|nr:hypothetical protein SAMN04489764_1863 [Thermostaphylospora chromogena]
MAGLGKVAEGVTVGRDADHPPATRTPPSRPL